LKHYHKNPRQITKKEFADLRDSLRKFGDLSGIVKDIIFIYVLRVISDESIFYIGKTTNMSKRVSQHRDKAKKGISSKLYNFIRHLWENGEDFELVELVTVNKVGWEKFEIEAINLARKIGCNLRNTSDGGIAHDHTEESRKKISIAMSGKKFTKEHRAKLSLAKKGKPTWNKGIHTGQKNGMDKPEVRANLSKKLKGRKFSPETLQRMRMAAIGRVPVNKGVRGLQGKAVQQIDLVTGDVITTYKNQAIALESVAGKSTSRISECVNGKAKKAYGYGWKYA
jgi:hypothetical protein